MTTRLRRTLPLTVFGIVWCWPGAARGQFREPPPPPAYAIENATVIHSDGRTETGVTIVVRGALIEAMGPGVTAPADATVLEGDSLYVYPGLVDAQGGAELDIEELETPDSVRTWDAPRDLQGMLAHRRVADHLNHERDAIKQQRAQGIVAAGIFPDRALAAGIGAAIINRTDIARQWDLIANDNLGLAMAFQGGRGVYPGTLFGVIAYIRQSFEDARRAGTVRVAHQQDPSGMSAPGSDPDYEVLRAAMEGRIPVYFSANQAEDIRRVLRLADEYTFRPVIVGGHEAWRVRDELARRDIPVLIDGDFPRPDKWKTEDPEEDDAEADTTAADTTAADTTAADTTTQADQPSQEPEPLEPAAAREKKRIEDIRANAARLAEAGVRFGITSGGGDGDVLEAARISIEYGLSENVALRALTSTPAELLGISHMTRIGAGMSATFIAANGPLFDEDSGIMHVFVQGEYEEGAAGDRGGAAPTVSVTGSWDWNFTSGGQEFPMQATLEMEADGPFTGSVSGDQFGAQPIRGRVSGNSMRFTITLSFGGQTMELTGEATVEGDRMSGQGEGPFGTFSVTGRKEPGAEARRGVAR